MEPIKVVLLFNEEDERQRAVGRFLKTQKRCKTAFITEIVFEWLQRRETEGINTQSDRKDVDFIDRIKAEILSDQAFLEKLLQKSGVSTETLAMQETGQTEENTLDMDEDLLLAGLSVFEMNMV